MQSGVHASVTKRAQCHIEQQEKSQEKVGHFRVDCGARRLAGRKCRNSGKCGNSGKYDSDDSSDVAVYNERTR
jgi:hypothetical protein